MPAGESPRLDYGEAFREDVALTLTEIGQWTMPFGKYGPEHFPPNGVPIYDLPWDYLHWFATRGFPKGRLGELLEIIYHLKEDGSDEVFDPFRRAKGGRHGLRKAAFRPRSQTFDEGSSG